MRMITHVSGLGPKQLGLKMTCFKRNIPGSLLNVVSPLKLPTKTRATEKNVSASGKS